MNTNEFYDGYYELLESKEDERVIFIGLTEDAVYRHLNRGVIKVIEKYELNGNEAVMTSRKILNIQENHKAYEPTYDEIIYA